MLNDPILDVSHEFKQVEQQSETSQMRGTIPITRTKIENFLSTMSQNLASTIEKKPKQQIISVTQEIDEDKQFTFGKSKQMFLDFINFILEEFKRIYQKQEYSSANKQITLEAIKIIIKVFLEALQDLSYTQDEIENEEKLILFKKEHQLDFKNYLQQKSFQQLSTQKHSLLYLTGLERLNSIQELLTEYMNEFFNALNLENQHDSQNYKRFDQSSQQNFKIIETIVDDLFTMFLIFDKKSLETTLNNYDVLGKEFASRVECKSNWWYKQERFGNADKENIKLSFAKVLEPEELKPSKDKYYHITIEKSYPEVFPIKLEKIYHLNLIKDQSYQSPQLLNSHLERDLVIPEYFHPKCRKKVLHYFEPGTKNLWTFDLEQLRLHLNKSTPPLQAYQKSIEKIIITDANFVISSNYRSLITPTGKIYLCGAIGSEDDGNFHSLATKPKTSVDNSLFLYKKMSLDGDQL